MTSNVDISDLGISKNLLRMNFMRRSLIAKNKLNDDRSSDLLPNLSTYTFKLPDHVDSYLIKRASIVKSIPHHKNINSLFSIYGTPAGFRNEFGVVNPSKENELSQIVMNLQSKLNKDTVDDPNLSTPPTKQSNRFFEVQTKSNLYIIVFYLVNFYYLIIIKMKTLVILINTYVFMVAIEFCTKDECNLF